MPYDPKCRNIELLISVATLCVGYMAVAKEIGFHMDCQNENECCSASHFSVEKLVVGCTFYGLGCKSNIPFDIIRDNHCNIPSKYRCAGLTCIAYELQNTSSDLHKLIKGFEGFNTRSPLEKLVQILKDPGFTDRASIFKTDSTYESFELSFTFATKIFNGHLPLKVCRATLPRIWDMKNNELIPYMGGTSQIVGFISHVWKTKEEVEKNGKEVTYADCHNGQVPSNDNKLTEIRNQLRDVCQYWWMDTLCINKADLAELDMSIRSMHSWYSEASIVAVPSNQDLDVWMSRGWCLQECQAAGALLIETSNLPRGGYNMLITFLKMGCMKGDMPASLWLSLMEKRQTTRLEDKAYSLIGLLGIDFQIMYGEGERAWTRLIEQLAIQKGDLSWMIGSACEVHEFSKTSLFNQLHEDYNRELSRKLGYGYRTIFDEARDFSRTGRSHQLQVVPYRGLSRKLGFGYGSMYELAYLGPKNFEIGCKHPKFYEQLSIERRNFDLMVASKYGVHETSKCFIPYYIQGNDIAPQIAKRPIRVSHVGMELYVQVAKNQNDTYKTLLKVFGTDIVLYVEQHDDMIYKILKVEFSSDMNFRSEVQPLWLCP
jgi:hypothetical protein